MAKKLNYAIEVRNMHNGIHNLLIVDNLIDANELNAYLETLKECEDKNKIEVLWILINRIDYNLIEINYKDVTTKNGDKYFENIKIINYNSYDICELRRKGSPL
jgi:hypothetical protein